MPNNRIKVLIAEDSTVMRALLVHLLRADTSLEVIGAVGSAGVCAGAPTGSADPAGSLRRAAVSSTGSSTPPAPRRYQRSGTGSP